jgi:hypothetical protein
MSISNFLAQVTKLGLARQNRFEVQIPNLFGDERLISLFCQSATLPGASLALKKQTLFGPAYIRPASINYGESITLSFLCDKDMLVRKAFDKWIHSIVNPSSFTVNYKDEYARTITINQLDEKENYTYTIQLIDAFPTVIGALSLNQAALDRFHILPVTFSYRVWETGDITNTDIFQSTIVGPEELLKTTRTTQPQLSVGRKNTAEDYIKDERAPPL